MRTNGRLMLQHGFEISRRSDRDDIDSAKAVILRAFDEATYSPGIVKFEIWKPLPETNGQTVLPFLPAEASTNVKIP